MNANSKASPLSSDDIDALAKSYKIFQNDLDRKLHPIYFFELEILEYHLDSFGHVNNAKYLEIYEMARWDFITKNGMGLKEIHANSLGPVLLDLNLTFKRELKNRETIQIFSQAQSFKNKLIFNLEQVIINSSQKIASTLSLNCGLMDLKERKLISPTPEWLKAFGLPPILNQN